MEIDYYEKYIKYRTKYLQLKEELEGGGAKFDKFKRFLGIGPPKSKVPLNPEKPEYLSKGSFGVVMTAIPCVPECTNPKCTHAISKIMIENEADNEVSIYKDIILDKIDKDGNFFINLIHSCNNKKVVKDKKILMYENGGIDLSIYINKLISSGLLPNTKTYIKNIKYILKKLLNILEGIVLLNKNGIYHCDIKLNNIVTGLHDPIKFSNLPEDNKFRLIDFGLAQKIDKFIINNYVLNNEIYFYNTIYYRPLEFILLTTINHYNRDDIINDINIFNTYDFIANTSFSNNNINIHNRMNNRTSNLIRDNYKQKKILINDIQKEAIINRDNIILVNILKTVDIYSFGILLLELSNTINEPFKSEIISFVFNNELLNPDYTKRPKEEHQLIDLIEKYKLFIQKIK